MSFKPLWGLHNPVIQTILGSKLPGISRHPEIYQQIMLPDKDILALALTTPATWTKEQPTIVALHGLGGDHRSKYIGRLRSKVFKAGYRFIAVNFRGCGIGSGLAKGIYHAGCSTDVLQVLQQIKQATPDSPIVLVGYSLGGNVALKLAAELAGQAADYLAGVIAITPPVDLARCADLICLPNNQIFRRYYLRLLWQAVQERYQAFPELGVPPTADMSYGFWEFDDKYTAPHSGFLNVHDYYQRCSTLPLLADIEIPCKILFAADDPFVDSSAVNQTRLAMATEVLITSHGGHMGFLAAPTPKTPLRWMDHKINIWLEELLACCRCTN